MHGIILIDKPAGITSHDVVNRVRRILGIKRVGHTGTLDPFATGLIVILVGHATRLAQYLDKDEKEYEALVQFGSETDTGDVTGSRIADRGLGIGELEARFAATDWEEVLAKFRGEIMQVPPMYSAKKVDGKKLYELARKGEEVERRGLTVTIHELEMIAPGEAPTLHSALRLKVLCSAGTYVRTLGEDIGRATGLGAHLTELRRTQAGRFDISKAITLEELEAGTDRSRFLMSMSQAVGHLPALQLNEERVGRTRNGLSTRTDLEFVPGSGIRMLDPAGNMVAVGEFNEGEKTVQPKVVFGLESE
jgi:tRNA pseudouridine55 synthase